MKTMKCVITYVYFCCPKLGALKEKVSSITIEFEDHLLISDMRTHYSPDKLLLWSITFALLAPKRTLRDLWPSTEIFIT